MSELQPLRGPATLALVLWVGVSIGSADDHVLNGHLSAVTMGRFTPDGTRALTVSTDQSAILWDLKTRQPLRRFEGHTGPIYSLAIAANGRSFVTGAQDNTLRLWDLPLPGPLTQWKAHERAARQLAASPDGQTIVSTSADQSVRLWNATKAATEPSGSRAGHAAEVATVAFRADGSFFATGDVTGQVLLWNPAVDELQADFAAHEGGVTSLQFHPNNQQLVSVGADGTVKTWQVSALLAGGDDLKPVRVINAHTGPIRSLALLAGGAQSVTCATDNRVVVTNLSNGEVVRELEGLEGDVLCVATRRDNQRVAAGTSAGKVAVWNAANGELQLTLELSGSIKSLAYSADNQKLAVAAGNNLTIFGPSTPANSGPELIEHYTASADTALTHITFAPDNLHVWSAHESGHVSRWAYAAPTQRRQFNHGGPVYGVAISREGDTIVSCSTDQTVRIWNGLTGQQRASMSGHQGAVHAVALSPDEAFAVSSGADNTLRLWDVTGGRQLKQLATTEETMYSVAIDPTGKRVAAGGADRKIHLFDMITGAEQLVLSGHSDYIHCVRFNPAGNKLLSYGYAGHLKLWNLAGTSPLFEQRIGRVGNFADYAADGAALLLCNGDGTARTFELPANAR